MQVREAAAALGIGERTLWRRLGAETLSRKPRDRYEVTEADRDAYWAWRGNVAVVHRDRVAAGAVPPTPARKPCKPWATLFVDGFSRVMMGWALSLVPTSAVVLAALRQGIVVDPDRGPFGGLPERLRPDNGLEFAAKAIERSCAALGIELDPAPPYQGYSKGKVERVNRSS